MKTNVQFTTFQLADVNTCHITPADGKLLDADDLPGLVAVCGDPDNPSGAIFAVLRDYYKSQLADLRTAGFSEAFINIFIEARKQGIMYVRFDPVCDAVKGLPTFNWE